MILKKKSLRRGNCPQERDREGAWNPWGKGSWGLWLRAYSGLVHGRRGKER